MGIRVFFFILQDVIGLYKLQCAGANTIDNIFSDSIQQYEYIPIESYRGRIETVHIRL